MWAIGAGLAVWGAWSCVAALLNDHNSVARDENRGCAWPLALFAAMATVALIDAVSGN